MEQNNSDRQKRAAIYIRVSDPSQAGNSSPKNQEEKSKKWCEYKGITVYKIYKDIGISGASDEGRLDFQQLMSDAETGMFDFVICSYLDRFARSLRLLLDSVHRLDKVGIAFICTEQSIDTSDKLFGRVFLHLLGVFAEWERCIIAERTKIGKQSRAKVGIWPAGQPGLGYELDKNGTITKNAKEVQLVKYIFELAMTHGAMALAKRLNVEGTPHPRTKIEFPINARLRDCGRYRKRKRNSGYCKVSDAWSNFDICKACAERYGGTIQPFHTWGVSVIKKILNNRIYVGEVKWGTTIGHNPELAIIDKEQFEEVHKKRKKFSQIPSRSKSSLFLLTGGTMVCKKCGNNFQGINRRQRGGQRYECSGRREKGICDQKTFDRVRIETEVIGEIETYVNNHSIDLSNIVYAEHESNYRQEYHKRVQYCIDRKKNLSNRIKQIRDTIISIRGRDKKLLDELLEEKKKLDNQFEEVNIYTELFLVKDKVLLEYDHNVFLRRIGEYQYGKGFKYLINTLEPPFKQNLLRQFVKRIIVDNKGKVRIIWEKLDNITL